MLKNMGLLFFRLNVFTVVHLSLHVILILINTELPTKWYGTRPVMYVHYVLQNEIGEVQGYILFVFSKLFQTRYSFQES